MSESSENIARLICQQDPLLLSIFGEGFRSAGQWMRYISDHFGGATASVTKILDKGDHGWSAGDFQALYIACWIHFPVEKGSFMIEVDAVQRANVKSGYEKLGWRKSSHFSGHGRSAAQNYRTHALSHGREKWEFLAGYDELLVQLEGGGRHSPGPGSYLFLKCEGHTMATVAHMKSWITKIRTGHGETASPLLNYLAESKSTAHYGITQRAAENFGKPYGKVLKALGFHGNTTTIQVAAGRMYEAILQVISGHAQPLLVQLQQRLGSAGLAVTTTGAQIATLPNAQLAMLLENVILPLVRALGGMSEVHRDREAAEFVRLMAAANQDITGIARRLREDAANVQSASVERVSEEIRVKPAVIDRSLQSFFRILAGIG